MHVCLVYGKEEPKLMVLLFELQGHVILFRVIVIYLISNLNGEERKREFKLFLNIC